MSCVFMVWRITAKIMFFLFDSHTSFLKLFFFNAFLTFLCICAFMANCFSCKETAETTKPFLLQCQNLSKETQKPTAKCKNIDSNHLSFNENSLTLWHYCVVIRVFTDISNSLILNSVIDYILLAKWVDDSLVL